MTITTEPRTNFADATKRLVDITVSRPSDWHVHPIGGWSAVEIRFREPVPRRGDRDGFEATASAPLNRRVEVAVAFENELVKFRIWPSSEQTEPLQETISVWL